MPETYDVYLVLHPVRGNLARFRAQARPLQRIERIYLDSAEIFYRPCTDTALMALCFTRHALAHLGEDAVHLLAQRSKLPMVVPACMPSAELRDRFLEHLAAHDLRICASHGPGNSEAGAAIPAAGPIGRVLDRLARELAILPTYLPVATPADAMRDLPLFRPSWQRGETAPGLDATGC